MNNCWKGTAPKPFTNGDTKIKISPKKDKN